MTSGRVSLTSLTNCSSDSPWSQFASDRNTFCEARVLSAENQTICYAQRCQGVARFDLLESRRAPRPASAPASFAPLLPARSKNDGNALCSSSARRQIRGRRAFIIRMRQPRVRDPLCSARPPRAAPAAPGLLLCSAADLRPESTISNVVTNRGM